MFVSFIISVQYNRLSWSQGKMTRFRHSKLSDVQPIIPTYDLCEILFFILVCSLNNFISKLSNIVHRQLGKLFFRESLPPLCNTVFMLPCIFYNRRFEYVFRCTNYEIIKFSQNYDNFVGSYSTIKVSAGK